MALDNSPFCFRYDGWLWVSELPRDEARAQLDAQRAWDRSHVKQQRWVVAISLGAVVGVAALLGLGIALGSPPTSYLLGLPVGFAVGAVLGALVNKWILGPQSLDESERPRIVPLTRVPFGVSRKAPEDASAADIIRWSRQRAVR